MSLDVNIEPEEFNTTELHDCIEELAKIKGIEDFEYEVEFACERNESFIANLFRVTIKESEKENKFSVIVKTLINTTRQELFSELHRREVFVYKEVIPNFIAIQNDIDKDNRVVLPECLLTSTDKGKEVIILEDLSSKNFTMDGKIAKFEMLDYLQVRLVMTELAKLHGLSFISENKNQNFLKVSAQLHDIMFNDSFLNKSKLRSYYNNSFNASVRVVTDNDIRKKLEKVEPKLIDILKRYVQPSNHNVLCHGDCWINNVLFKYQERKQSQVCFIDFQAMRYANPATDIVYFMYLCTDSRFRSEYIDTLLNVYYESLKNFLNLYGIDIKNTYPKDEFQSDIEENLPFGLLMAMIDMKIITTNDNDEYHSTIGGHEASSSSSTATESNNKYFDKRINDVIKESVDNGVLNILIGEVK